MSRRSADDQDARPSAVPRGRDGGKRARIPPVRSHARVAATRSGRAIGVRRPSERRGRQPEASRYCPTGRVIEGCPLTGFRSRMSLMPYHPWNQFRTQRASVGLPVDQVVLQQRFPSRPLIHSRWNNHDTYNPADVPLIGVLPPWTQNNGGVVTIQTGGLLPEFLDGIRYYAAMLESIIHHQPRIIRATAGGAVIYDRTTDKLYYAASRYLPGLQVHASLLGREQQLPVVQTHAGPVHTLVPNRHAQTCAEFQALNHALRDGAQEQNLDLWCFRVRTIEPQSRCANCRVTVPAHALARIWTC